MMPELSMADALGASGKPIMRVHTAGSVGGSTALVATHLVQTGVHDRVLTVADREAGRGERGVGPRRGPQRWHGRRRDLRAVDAGLHDPHRRARPHRVDGRREGPPQRGEEPLRAPADARPHHRGRQGVPDAVGADPLPRVVPLVGWRVRAGAHHRGRRPAARPGTPPAWVLGTAMRSELGTFPGRDPVRPQAGVECAHEVYDGPGSRTPAARSTSPSSTSRSPGTSRCGSRATTSPGRATAGAWSRAGRPRSTARSR